MTPFSSVAILEKLALLNIASCKAPALSRASLRWTSVATSSVPPAGMAESRFCDDMSQPPSSLLTGVSMVVSLVGEGVHSKWSKALENVTGRCLSCLFKIDHSGQSLVWDGREGSG